MLSTKVKTTSDLMSIALQAEREAIRRYSQLSTEMDAANNEAAAALFKRMIIEEEKHEQLLLEWMTQENIDENHEIEPISWRDPKISTTYDEEARDPYQSTPYKALAFAVHNEEIAFRFYTHVAAESDNEAVRKYAEILAKEELGHAALLRAERRLAYHAEREAELTEPRLDAKSIHSESDLLTAVIHIDHYLADQMNMITISSPEINSLVRQTRQQISENEHKLKEMIKHGDTSPSEDIASNLEKIKLYNEKLEKTATNESSRLLRLCACCDRSFAFYDAIVESNPDEAIILIAQKLTSSSLDRIGVFKQVLGDSYLSDEPNN